MIISNAIRHRNKIRQVIRSLPFQIAGQDFVEKWKTDSFTTQEKKKSDLEQYFDKHDAGPGVWKWRHYFDVYTRHLSKFVDREFHFVEIGIYSGGSLDMWRAYFGIKAHIYGIDIEPACKAYEKNNTRIFIGDQEDREFWRRFKLEVPRVDVVIDDGGHKSRQQIVTLEEMLPHMEPGGVFVCEDIHGSTNAFNTYCQGLTGGLSAATWTSNDLNGAEIRCKATEFQRAISSVSFYPFMTVIEKLSTLRNEFVAPKHGTEWQPFYGKS